MVPLPSGKEEQVSGAGEKETVVPIAITSGNWGESKGEGHLRKAGAGDSSLRKFRTAGMSTPGPLPLAPSQPQSQPQLHSQSQSQSQHQSQSQSQSQPQVPSLFDLCLDQVASSLPTLYSPLRALSPVPTPLAARLLTRVEKRCGGARHLLVTQLRLLCEAWFHPNVLSLPHHPRPLYLPGLSVFGQALRRVDLSACPWIRTGALSVLPSLKNLFCLRLNANQHLHPTELAYVSALPSLRCLELQGWSTLDDTVLLPYLYSLPNLVSLNLSSSPVSDSLLEGLSYGLRLATWQKEAAAAKAAANKKRERELSAKGQRENVAAQAYKKAKDAAAEAWAGAGHSWNQNQQAQSQSQSPSQSQAQAQSQVAGEAGEGGAEGSASQWPLFSELRVLRLRDTRCTKQGAQLLTAFPALSCLDVRGTHISRHFLQPLQTKGKLSCSPNEPQVLAQSNKVLIDLQKGAQCGCQLLGIFPAASGANKGATTSAVATTGMSPGAVPPRSLANSGMSSRSASNRNSTGARLSVSRGVPTRGEPVGGEEKQWQELCLRGALAYLEAAGSEEAAGRQPL